MTPAAVDTLVGVPALGADARAADPADSLVGARLGPWVLERLLGRGGMGRVYEAREERERGGRRVAVKVLSEALAQDPHFKRRFEREAKTLATLAHPHLVEVLDQGESGGRLWFAMEYVRGETLRRRLERGALPPPEAARIASEIASALAYAHGRGVVHRDLKPENVLLGEDGRVRLADFGLLRLAREQTPEATTRLTRTDVILGTYEYMAPEQRRGQAEVDGRTDVFALGVMLYECLTGRLPLGRFTPATELVPGLPRGVDAVIHQAMAPEPKERTASAQAFADALKRAMAGAAPALAGPVERAEPVRGAAALPASHVDEDAHARTLNHVEILCVLNKVAAILLIVVGVLLTPLLLGIPMVVGGILLLKVARRLRELRPGAREAQIAASILLLVLFPLGTALGIYGLIVVAPTRAREALERERRRRSERHAGGSASAPLARPAPLPYVSEERPLRRVEILVPEPHEGPGLLPRLLLVAAVIWTVFLGVAGLRGVRASEWPVPARVAWSRSPGPEREAVVEREVQRFHEIQQQAARAQHRAMQWSWLACSAGGLVLSGLVAVRRHRQRHRRRGFGLAFAAGLLFLVDTALLGTAALGLAAHAALL